MALYSITVVEFLASFRPVNHGAVHWDSAGRSVVDERGGRIVAGVR